MNDKILAEIKAIAITILIIEIMIFIMVLFN